MLDSEVMSAHRHPPGKKSDPSPTVPLNGFQPEFLDFQRGIRVGRLEPSQRITQILKLSLESLYQHRFVIDRFGRGVYWRWICFLPRENRAVKPLSYGSNFGCTKFFVILDAPERLFKAGVQVERGLLQTPPDRAAYRLQEDWDWHRLLDALEDETALYEELRRVVQEDGFSLFAGN